MLLIYSVNSIEKSEGNIVSWVEIRWTWNWCRCHHKVEVASEGNGNENRVKSGVGRREGRESESTILFMFSTPLRDI